MVDDLFHAGAVAAREKIPKDMVVWAWAAADSARVREKPRASIRGKRISSSMKRG